jgi:hypothetical protein
MAHAASAPPSLTTAPPAPALAPQNIQTSEIPRAHGATPPAPSNQSPAKVSGYLQSAFSSTTASRPSRVTLSTSIIARSEAENAGTCEYCYRGSSESSSAATSFTTSDSSHRSGCSRHHRLSRGPSACRTSPTLRISSSNSFRFPSFTTRCAAPTPNTNSGTLRKVPGSAASRRRKHRDFRLRHQRPHQRNRPCKPLMNLPRHSDIAQPRRNISPIQNLNLPQFFLALFQFSFSPSTTIFPAFAVRQTSSHKIPNVSAASIDPCGSCPFTPSNANPDCPRFKSPRE